MNLVPAWNHLYYSVYVMNRQDGFLLHIEGKVHIRKTYLYNRKLSFYIRGRKNIILELDISYLSDMYYMISISYMIDMFYMSYQQGMYYQDDMLLYMYVYVYDTIPIYIVIYMFHVKHSIYSVL